MEDAGAAGDAGAGRKGGPPGELPISPPCPAARRAADASALPLGGCGTPPIPEAGIALTDAKDPPRCPAHRREGHGGDGGPPAEVAPARGVSSTPWSTSAARDKVDVPVAVWTKEALFALLTHFAVRRAACLSGMEDDEGLRCRGDGPFCATCKGRVWRIFTEQRGIEDPELLDTLSRARQTAVLGLCLNLDVVLGALARKQKYREILCNPDAPTSTAAEPRILALHRAVDLLVQLGLANGLTYDASATGLEGIIENRRCAAILRFVQVTQHTKDLLTSHLMIARDASLEGVALRNIAREELFQELGKSNRMTALNQYVKFFEEVHPTTPYKEYGSDSADSRLESIEEERTVCGPARRLIRLLRELASGRAGERYLTHMETEECVDMARAGSLCPPPPAYVEQANKSTLQTWIRNMFGTSKEVLRCIHKPKERLHKIFSNSTSIGTGLVEV